MAGVSIRVEYDDKAVAQGTEKTTQQFEQMGQRIQRAGQQGNVVLTQMEQNAQRNSAAMGQLGNVAGEALGGIESGGMAAAQSLSMMVPVLGMVLLGVINHRKQIAQLAQEWGGYTEEVRKGYEEEIRLNEDLMKAIERREHKRRDIELIGLSGSTRDKKELGFARADLDQARKDAERLDQDLQKLQAKAKEVRTETQYAFGSQIQVQVPTDAAREAASKIAEANRELAKQQSVVKDLELEVKSVEKSLGVALGDEASKRADQFGRSLDSTRDKVERLGEAWETKGLSGVEAVRERQRQAEEELREVLQKRPELADQVNQAIVQIEAGAQREITAIHKRESEERVREQKRQVDEFARDYMRNVEERDREEKRSADEAARAQRDAQRQIVDEQRRATEQMATNFESLFEDISNGNVGKRILRNVQRLFANILASWFSTTGQMSSGGGLGGLLGGLLLGGWGGTGVSRGGGVITTPPFFGGSSSSSGPSVTAGQMFAGPMINSFLPGGGFSIGPNGQIVAGDGSSSSSSPSFLASMFGAPGGSRGAALLGTLAMTGGMIAGSKFGGMSGQIGTSLSMLGIMAAAGNPQALAAASALGLAPAILAGVGGGLTGFGVGLRHGPLAGGLTGAGVGLGTAGMMAMLGVGLGPVGWIAAGAIGLLGGLFGGFLGQSRREKQANQIASAVGSELSQIVQAYKAFKLDYQSAIGQLQALDSQAQQQLGGLKGEGRKVYDRYVSRDISNAIGEVSRIEDARQMRGAMEFSPPMFHGGGYVSGQMSGWRLSSGEVAAILQQGEMVMNRNATAKNRAQLEAMNAGGDPGAGATIYIENLHAIDLKSFEGYINKNWDAIQRTNRSKKTEGKGLF